MRKPSIKIESSKEERKEIGKQFNRRYVRNRLLALCTLIGLAMLASGRKIGEDEEDCYFGDDFDGDFETGFGDFGEGADEA